MTVVSLLLAVLLSADKPADDVDEVRAAVEMWIKQLDAPTLAERSRAERELLDLGPKVLRWLPPSELLPQVSTREAVKSVRFQLQKRLARESAQPSRVTLSGEFTLPALLTEITRQTKNRIELDDEVPAKATAKAAWSLNNVTFWDAVDRICQARELFPVAEADADRVMLTPSASIQPPLAVFHAGVLRAELLGVQRQAVTGDPTRRLVRLRGELALEPRLRPLFVHFKETDFTAITPSGDSLAPWNPEARYELPMAGASRRTRITWDFITPADKVPEQLSLTGKVLVQLAAATEPIRFEQLQTDQEVLRRRGGVSVRLAPVEFTDNVDGSRSAKIQATVNYEAGGPAFESHRTWVYHNAAWIESGGKRLPFTDFDTLQQANGSVQLEYRFANLPNDKTLKFVYEAPTLLLDVPLDVEFKDIAVEPGK